MAITDLTGYTWVGNVELTTSGLVDTSYYLDFLCDGTAYNYISIQPYNEEINVVVYNNTWVYMVGYWGDEKYRTIEITGGNDATNPDLIAWFEANGTLTKGGGGGTMLDVTYNSTKIIDSLEVTPPVTVTYNGSTIATLNAGDTKTLQCNGKVMASNVVIGDKTLQCNGKLMASDVVVEVGG